GSTSSSLTTALSLTGFPPRDCPVTSPEAFPAPLRATVAIRVGRFSYLKSEDGFARHSRLCKINSGWEGAIVKKSLGFGVTALVLLPVLCLADSTFDGTWKGDLSTAKVSAKPDAFLLQDGTYTCKTCTPPVKVAADGNDHPVTGSPYYDSLNVSVLDERTILKTAKKAGKTVLTSKFSVAADGASASTDFTDATATNGTPVTGTFAWQRVA